MRSILTLFAHFTPVLPSWLLVHAQPMCLPPPPRLTFTCYPPLLLFLILKFTRAPHTTAVADTAEAAAAAAAAQQQHLYQQTAATATTPTTTAHTIMSAMLQDADSPLDATRVLLQSRTSTDGSWSPKPRWCRGPPEAAEGDPNIKREQERAALINASDEAPGHLTSLQHFHVRRKSYMAWSWLLEDEAEREPTLCKPADVATLQMPELGVDEQELLCQTVAHRLIQVSSTCDTTVLIVVVC